MWVVGVGYNNDQKDPAGENAKNDIIELGFSGVKEVRTLQTYVIDGVINGKEVEKIAGELLADKIIQFFNYSQFSAEGRHAKNLVQSRNVWAVEVFFRKGVMDPVGLSVEKAVGMMGISGVSVRTGTTYVIKGELKGSELKTICEKCLANGMIQTYRYQRL